MLIFQGVYSVFRIPFDLSVEKKNKLKHQLQKQVEVTEEPESWEELGDLEPSEPWSRSQTCWRFFPTIRDD